MVLNFWDKDIEIENRAMMKANEISDILEMQLKEVDVRRDFEEVGTVMEVGDGVAHVFGLEGVQANELVEFDPDRRVVEEAIAGISDEKQRQIDWTAVWGKRYPVLTTYQETVDVTDYAPRFTERCWTA